MTDLYKRIIQYAEKKESVDGLALEKKVWDPTPFVIDVYIGKRNSIDDDEQDIREYCIENFGKESWPIYNKPADWYRCGATVDGWTWFGFKTEQMMLKFISDWPENTKQKKGNDEK